LLQRVQKERTKRELQNDLIAFTKYFFEAKGEKFIVNSHHEDIADVLEKLKRGELYNENGDKCTVVIINIPPRYGKTEEIVINWPAQCIAQEPRSKFIHLSYSDDLALDNSSKCKELILSDEYQDFWPITLKDDSKSKKKWYTKEGGGLYATSAGGAITGFGAGSTQTDEFMGAIIIDDPLKVDDAERDGERDRINQRLNTTIKSRRNNRSTPIIIVMQRLHEEDMSGFVLNGGINEPVYHLKIPAIKPNGEALWPFKHTIEDLEKERYADPRTFAGQMMQEPSPEDGDFFKREWFNRYDLDDEPDLYKYHAADYAVSEGKGDYTEQGVCGFDKDENLWMVDWWSGQTAPDEWIKEEIRLVEVHEPYVSVAEAGLIRRSIEPFLKKEMQKTGTYYRKEWLASNQNKAANARAFQALASQGKVYIPNTPWGEELITQLLKFPTGKYDDKVDVCGLFGRILDKTFSPREITENEQDVKDVYETEDDEDEGWKTS